MSAAEASAISGIVAPARRTITGQRTWCSTVRLNQRVSRLRRSRGPATRGAGVSSRGTTTSGRELPHYLRRRDLFGQESPVAGDALGLLQTGEPAVQQLSTDAV